MWIELITAFLLGLLSSTHCLAMCGGITGALTYSLEPGIRQNPFRFALFNLHYNAGRIFSYAIAGLIVGGSAGTLAELAGANSALFMRSLGVITMLGVGFYVAGWFPRFAYLEKIGAPVWKHLSPVGQRLLPVRRLPQAFGFGVVWGWLPCGLVYSALIYSLSTADMFSGALFMVFFGLGTLPMLLAIGFMARAVGQFMRRPIVRRIAGSCIVLMAPLPIVLDRLNG